MSVVPEESNGSADHGATKDSQLSNLGHSRQFKICRKCRVAAHICEHCERASRDDGAADRQTIETIGQVHRIACADDHQHDKDDKRQERNRPQTRVVQQAIDNQVRMKLLQKRHN